MPVSADALTAFRAAVGDVPLFDDAKTRRTKSTDYNWYSPILEPQLSEKVADLVAQPRDEDELRRVIGACARGRIPLVARGGGTGTHGQCVPLHGGVVIDMTALDKIVRYDVGFVRSQAGARIEAVESALPASQMLPLFPTTKRLATVGGYLAVGWGGVGSLIEGMASEAKLFTGARVLTVEENPRSIDLRGDDVALVRQTYGLNGVAIEVEMATRPKRKWAHAMAVFKGYKSALRFALSAQAHLECAQIAVLDARVAPFFPKLKGHFNGDAVLAIVAAEQAVEFRRRAEVMGGELSFCGAPEELAARSLPPAWDCAWHHASLQGFKHSLDYTALQLLYPAPFDVALVQRQLERHGEDILFHHEFARMDGRVRVFAIPLVRWVNPARLQMKIEALRGDGCIVSNPHHVLMEDVGISKLDARQLAFKRDVDPYGLLNPGKSRAVAQMGAHLAA